MRLLRTKAAVALATDIHVQRTENLLDDMNQHMQTASFQEVADLHPDVINPLASKVRELEKELRLYKRLTYPRMFNDPQEQELVISQLLDEPRTLRDAKVLYSTEFFDGIQDPTFIQQLTTALLDKYSKEQDLPTIWRELNDNPYLMIDAPKNI